MVSQLISPSVSQSVGWSVVDGLVGQLVGQSMDNQSVGDSSIIRRFVSPNFRWSKRFRVLSYTLLQMLAQSPHLRKSRVRVRVRVKVTVSENTYCSTPLWTIKPSNYGSFRMNEVGPLVIGQWGSLTVAGQSVSQSMQLNDWLIVQLISPSICCSLIG